MTTPHREVDVLAVMAELQAEVRGLRDQLTKMEQWVFAVDVSVGELDSELARKFRGLES